MINFDLHKLFAYTLVQTIVSQTTSQIVFTVLSGDGALFGTPSQGEFVPASTMIPLKTNSMIGKITAITGDQITVDITSGNREGSQQFTIQPGYQFGAPLTPKVLTDIENVLNGITSGATLLSPTLQNPLVSTPQINFGSDANGDIIIRNGLGVTSRLAIGSNGQFLGISGGLPAWQTITQKGILQSLLTTNTIVNSNNTTTTDMIALSLTINPTIPVDIEVAVTLDWYNNGNNSNYADVQLDGLVQGNNPLLQFDCNTNYNTKAVTCAAIIPILNVSAGTHIITVQYRATGGTATINSGALTVKQFGH